MLIHAHIYNPTQSLFKGGRSNPAEVQLIECENYEKCDLYKNKQCRRRNILSWYCPYGRNDRIVGPTPRAKKFYTFINENTNKYKDIPRLEAPTQKMAKIDDYILLDYSHVEMNEAVPFLGHSSAFVSGRPFLKIENWTVENILKIINFRPQALFGGEITSYQKEVIPLFLQDLAKFDKEMYSKVLAAKPELKPVSKKDYLGREALLHTLNYPCEVVISDKKWFYDGKTLKLLENTKLGLFSITLFSEPIETLAVKVESQDIKVTITSENQVGEKTIFC